MKNIFRRNSPRLPRDTPQGVVALAQRLIKLRVGALGLPPAPIDQDAVGPRGISYAPILPPPTPPALFDPESEAYRAKWETVRGIIAGSPYRPLEEFFFCVQRLSLHWNDPSEWGFLRRACQSALLCNPPVERPLGAAIAEIEWIATDRAPDVEAYGRSLQECLCGLGEIVDDRDSEVAGRREAADLLRRALSLCLAARLRFCC